MQTAIFLLLFTPVMNCATSSVHDTSLMTTVPLKTCENLGWFTSWRQGSKNPEQNRSKNLFPVGEEVGKIGQLKIGKAQTGFRNRPWVHFRVMNSPTNRILWGGREHWDTENIWKSAQTVTRAQDWTLYPGAVRHQHDLQHHQVTVSS